MNLSRWEITLSSVVLKARLLSRCGSVCAFPRNINIGLKYQYVAASLEVASEALKVLL